ncbi:MAG: hypothetical protein EOP50_13495 [Sphingobacteriales bacterium]|nr:MAG: hypothetical protein EOP50_13495 [Sphingobacteriales bacterium]
MDALQRSPLTERIPSVPLPMNSQNPYLPAKCQSWQFSSIETYSLHNADSKKEFRFMEVLRSQGQQALRSPTKLKVFIDSATLNLQRLEQGSMTQE